MRKKVVILAAIFLMLTANFASAYIPLKIIVDDNEVKNSNDEYITRDGKLYVSEDALKRDFGFIINRNNENTISLLDIEKIAYKSRSQLFEEFADIYDPKSPDNIANLWAEGIKRRNGAFQYLALNSELREKFKEEAIKKERLAWVTGFSSPWVKDYKITKREISKGIFRYKIVFNMTAVGYESTNEAELTVSVEDSKWRIIDITKNFDIM